MLKPILSVAAVTLILLGGCVSNKKYLAAKDRIAALQGDSLSLSGRLANTGSRLSAAEEQIGQMQGKIRQLEEAGSLTSNQLNQTQDEVQRQRQKVAQLQALIAQQRKAVEDLRQKMATALGGFNSEQLTVSTRNGRVYVSLQESLLFPSGSADVNPKGREALGTLANVLNQNPDISVLVEGHTDSLPITKRYEDNWALSTARSMAIVRVLLKDYKVDPTRLTASGRSQYEPIAPNSDPAGRAKNRRTEIILEPNLDELMRLLQES